MQAGRQADEEVIINSSPFLSSLLSQHYDFLLLNGIIYMALSYFP